MKHFYIFLRPFFMLSLCFLLLLCQKEAIAQSPFRGVLWVVPIDPSVLPINNTITGNDELNKVFEEFHVEKYYFLDSLYLNCSYIKPGPVYEIQLEKADILLDNQFID
ncbi:MAG: hypothetical protein LBU83_10905, partial [Bacteroidales bacterium]|nr:hypothetical protein [Bacteroidales bacterium]